MSLVGPKDNRCHDPALEEIAKLARGVAVTLETTDRPAHSVLTFLAELIEQSIQRSARTPFVQEIPERLREQLWFAPIVEPLLQLCEEGLAENRPTSESSLSLRLKRGPSVHCTESFAVLTQRTPDYFLVPSPQEMERIFSGPLSEVIPPWKELLN